LVKGCRVLLLDDVLTTGSTVDECGRVLKAAGAIDVAVIAVARALV
jgi:predicted amidophosphoribosyltransferase